MEKRDDFTIVMVSMVYGGDALGRLPDGRAVFVPYTLPGETVRIRLVEDRKNYARAELLEVVSASPERIRPLCPHFTVCSACQYQHLAYETQLKVKQQVISEQLERIAEIAHPPICSIRPSPVSWNYLSQVDFHLTQQGKPGFPRMRAQGVFEVTECHLPEDGLNDIWPRLEFEAGLNLSRVGLRLGSDDEALLILESHLPETPEFALDLPISAVFHSGGEEIVLAGDNFTVMEVLGRPFRVSAGSTFPVNTQAAAALVTHVLEQLPRLAGSTILNLYSGVGLFGAFLAERAGQVAAVEPEAAACDDFAINLDDFENVALYPGPVEEILPHLAIQPDAVVIAPPPAGMPAATLESLARMEPGQIEYVSSDPATLARDLRRLVKLGYRLVEVTPFDLFPQTYRVDCVAHLQHP